MLTPVVTELTEGTAHPSVEHEPCRLSPISPESNNASDSDEAVGPEDREL